MSIDKMKILTSEDDRNDSDGSGNGDDDNDVSFKWDTKRHFTVRTVDFATIFRPSEFHWSTTWFKVKKSNRVTGTKH